jgi:hydrogenase-1 operon protein HyaE
MNLAPDATPASLHPLLAQLVSRHGFAEVTAANFDAFVRTAGHVVLLFTEDPVRYKETLDLAVILPEIARAFPQRFAVGVLFPEAARACAPKYGFRRWPALVMLKDGGYVGAIDGLRGWDEYLQEAAALLTAPVTRPPSIGVAVTGPGSDGDGCAH